MILVGGLLGISANGVEPVDGGAAIWRNGKFVFSLPEERINRRKYSGGFQNALARGLEQLSLSLSDVDAFCFVSYGEPATHSIEHILQQAPELIPYQDRIQPFVSHHLAHALVAAGFAPQDQCLVAVYDNEGSIIGSQHSRIVTANPMERASYYLATPTSVDLLTRDLFGANDVSLGEAFRRFSYYCGFPSHQFAGKTMALAAYGSCAPFEGANVLVCDGTSLKVDLRGSYDHPAASVSDFFDRHGFAMTAPRVPGAAIEEDHRNAAAFIQHQLERAVGARLRYLLSVTGETAIAFAGGLAYNCKLIATLEDELGVPVFVPPSPGDQGLCMGAILSFLESHSKPGRGLSAESKMGGSYQPDRDVLASVAQQARAKLHVIDRQFLASVIVDRLCADKIVALMEGRSEIGRRALGARSFLCIPSDAAMDRLRELKHRELFRPFGASILDTEIDEIFPAGKPDPFMLRAPFARGDEVIRRVAHVDGTLRAQNVSSSDRTLLRDVLHEMRSRGMIALLVNTSLNRAGEPLVETVNDALAIFDTLTTLDLLVFADASCYLER